MCRVSCARVRVREGCGVPPGRPGSGHWTGSHKPWKGNVNAGRRLCSFLAPRNQAGTAGSARDLPGFGEKGTNPPSSRPRNKKIRFSPLEIRIVRFAVKLVCDLLFAASKGASERGVWHQSLARAGLAGQLRQRSAHQPECGGSPDVQHSTLASTT